MRFLFLIISLCSFSAQAEVGKTLYYKNGHKTVEVRLIFSNTGRIQDVYIDTQKAEGVFEEEEVIQGELGKNVFAISYGESLKSMLEQIKSPAAGSYFTEFESECPQKTFAYFEYAMNTHHRIYGYCLVEK
ncbi:MAG: hypothetical protein KDD38_06880 [Bdellovibrionales bacterium]|nr:hypothetical protein [Bdellovibrionales bacterium]